MEPEPHRYAASTPPSPPLEVRLAANGETLTLIWPSGAIDALDATVLRAACRCADCRKQRHDGRFPSALAPLTITGVDTMGTHALNIQFADGHARGIFPWAYLKHLAAGSPPGRN